MSALSSIEWTDATWQPVTGCSIVSPGCANCYAMRLAGGRLRHHPSRAGLTDLVKGKPVWNGQVRFNEKWLTQPLRWKQPRMIFVCAHGDLFHESVPDEWIDKVFAVMALCPQHQFQVLTKRAERMRAYLSDATMARRVDVAMVNLLADAPIARLPTPITDENYRWPLPQVWLGVSCERQQEAAERIPHLLNTPAAVRFVSAEPLLGPIDLHAYLPHPKEPPTWPKLAWIIVGGESGPQARPMHPDWARAIRDQCAAAGVAFFFKQWGEFSPNVFGVNDTVPPARVGKRAAGRLLDGHEHNGFPQVPA